jgi:drug/metabolite transporter (DMT)-like permease
VLHLLSSILTLASFGLSSVANTYIIRTLEPIMSCCLLYLLHGQRRSLLELLLLAVVAGATACVVLMGNPADKPLVLSSLLHASDAAQQLKSLQMPGEHQKHTGLITEKQ